MKFFLSIALFFSFCCFAQDSNKFAVKAIEAYESFDYSSAIRYYKKAADDSLTYSREIADCHHKLHQNGEAERWYKILQRRTDKSAMDVYNYASVLRENGKLELSEERMKEFSKMMSGADSRAVLYQFKSGQYKNLSIDDGTFAVHPLKSNTEHQDFGLVYYKDQVIFSSSRVRNKGALHKWNRNDLPFLDIYSAEEKEGDLSSVKPLNDKVNNKYHEGPVTFSPSGDLMVFTRNRYDTIADGEKAVLELWSSKLVDDEWQDPTPLPFNNPKYSVGHATLSRDGKWLFFASNMPGGYGGVDIYKVEILEDGSYKEPINMGQKVNSEGDEMFPVIHPDNSMLFFSSNGKYGLGGLDIFAVELNKFYISGKVRNLGAPINSPMDDFHLTISTDKKGGYFSSNREGGKGSDDIYRIEVKKEISFD